MAASRLRRWCVGHAVDLAVMRIVLAVLLLISAEVHRAPAYAESAMLGELARAGVVIGALLGLVGIRARIGFGLAALAGLYLLGLPHAAGVGLHNHHLVWFAAVLASSPCADALAWGRGRARPAPSLVYGLPMRAVWLILAAIYVWPGIWKLATSGAAWVTAENLRLHLYWKWAQSWTFEPLLRIDRVPGLLTAGAVAVVTFELTFPLLLVSRAGRWSALVGGLAFHALTAALFDIRFDSLWPLLVALVPWHRWLGGAADDPPAADRWPRVAPLLAACVLAVWIAGARGETRGWPLACYPTFAALARPTMPTLVVEVDGREVRLEDYAEPSPALWAEVWQLIGIGGPVRPAALERFWRRHHPGGGAVAFYRAEMAVEPERRAESPRRIRLLHRVALDP